MDVSQAITAQTNGATFRRVDLHIHTFGPSGSFDVKDADMTPERIVTLARKESLAAIAITDHNSIGNVRAATEMGNKLGIFVVPGVELSTTQGHLLVYLPDFPTLQTFFGKLDLSADKKLCNHTIPQCLKFAADFNGFGIAAHVDTDAGFDKAIPGYSPLKAEILKCRNLLGIEIVAVANESCYTLRDPDANRKNLFKERQNTPNLGHVPGLAKVLFSDAHSLDFLGRNTTGNRKLTRVKMESLSFDALRIALLDSSARVRIEDLVPESVPQIVGAHIEGGFLDGQVVHFSRNLTCIIGGRGTGKSTLLESVRAASGNSAKEGLVDSDIWPDRISLVYQDEAGRLALLNRDKCCDVVNATDSEDGITHIPIESYGQGETAERIQHCDKDPQILVRFLDDFLDLAPLQEEENALRETILQNQTTIERLDLETRSIPEVTKTLANTRAQIKTLKEQKANEIVSLEESLAKERSFRSSIVTKLNTFVKGVTGALATQDIAAFLRDYSAAHLVAGTAEFTEVKRLVSQYADSVGKHSSDLQRQADGVVAEINQQLKSWRDKEAKALERIDQLRKTLESQGLKLDMAFIRKTANDVDFYEKRLRDLTVKKTALAQAWKERRDLLAKRHELRERIFQYRQALAVRLTENLRETVVEYEVSIKFHEANLSPECEAIIQDAMSWRTSQVPRAAVIVKCLSVIGLLNALHTKDVSGLKAIKDDSGSRVFSDSDATGILDTLSLSTNRFRLETCPYEDTPEIKISKAVEVKPGEKRHIVRQFAQLSLGQQQAILLSILLFSDRNIPLIIDQPEDNLDNEFIYRTLVRNLRRVKERRQVIVVTHNANIAVLGDAELIIPLKSTNDRGAIVKPGSIDNPDTRDLTCEILEGGKQAFLKRKEIYGVM